MGGCQQSNNIHIAAPISGSTQSDTVFILQCDGHIESVGDYNSRIEQRRTYLIDTQNRKLSEWDSSGREWYGHSGSLVSSISSIMFTQTDNFGIYISEISAVFDRQAGNVVYREDLSFRDGDVKRNRFIAKCTKI